MEQFFLCPQCHAEMILPHCTRCGYNIPQIDSVWYFCKDESMKLEGEDQYIGYDAIGENFEPEIFFWDTNRVKRYGVYDACCDLLVEQFGTDITVLDLGAGLGTASIPLAKKGIYTIAADISAVMLTTAAKRAREELNNLILARMNAYQIMLPDNSVDIVVINALLHLVENPTKIINEIRRVLKPNGRLVCFNSYSLPLSEEELKQNRYCNAVLSDISEKYYQYLTDQNYKSLFFDNYFQNIILNHFHQPYHVKSRDFVEIFTDKMKFRLHRLKTGAHSDLQGIPKHILNAAWEEANSYAKEKYGDDYMDIKGFSKYGAEIEIYSMQL